ncbi:MAG: hypothetical protein OES57_03775 [Acidimicrobiia bacterium]|nr:hypothetical protein [Acidimicrobiia bacterium]
MRRWSAALAATVTLIGLALLLFGCGDDDDEGTVLATTEAGPIPEQAACPEGAEPDTPGPADQQRPQGSGAVDAAAFDSQSGRIVVLIETETWTFDVCTNTWELMSPAGAPLSDVVAGLVYDVDSDRTIAFGPDGEASVYDLEADSWTNQSVSGEVWGTPGVVYDPVSGLVVGSGLRGDISAYGIGADAWQEVPTGEALQTEVQVPALMSHHPGLDRLVVFGDPMSLVDPRTGEVTLVDPEDQEPTNTSAPELYTPGFWLLVFASDSEGRGIVYDAGLRRYHRYDPTVPAWEVLSSRDPVPVQTMAFDRLNERLVVGGGDAAIDEMWALDSDTGEWITLVPSSPVG